MNITPVERALSVRNVSLATVAVVVTLLLAQSILNAMGAILLVVISILLAAAVKIPATWLVRRGIPQGIAILLVLLAVVGLFAALLIIFVPVIVSEVRQVLTQLPDMTNSLITRLSASSNPVVADFAATLSAENAARWVTDSAGVLTGWVTRGFLNVGAAAVSLAFTLLTTVIIILYWTSNQASIERFWLSLVPATVRPRVLTTWRRTEERMGSYLLGTLVLAVVVGVLAGGGFLLLGVRWAVLLGLIWAVGEFIPTFGPMIAILVTLIITLPQGLGVAGLALVWSFVVQQAEGLYLTPNILGKAIGVNPLGIVVALLVFVSMIGPAGAVLAVPLAAFLQIVITEWVLSSPARLRLPVATDAVEAARLHLVALRDALREQLRGQAGPLNLDEEADGELNNLELAVARVTDALPARDIPDSDAPTVAGAWRQAALEYETLRRALQSLDPEATLAPTLVTTLRDLDGLFTAHDANARAMYLRSTTAEQAMSA